MVEKIPEESTYKRMCMGSVPKAAVTKTQYLFSNGYDKKHLATDMPFNITFEMLEQLKKEKKIKIRLDRGLIDVYERTGSGLQTRHIEGFFESNTATGMIIGSLTGPDADNSPKEECLMKNQKYVNLMGRMGLLNE
jgi:uncharacterized protein (DUF4415 family)